MINFEEESAKFRPSEEISKERQETENDQAADLSEILTELLQQMTETAKSESGHRRV